MARVIARGFPQVPGIDFQDTFSPNLTNYDPPRIMQRLIHIQAKNNQTHINDFQQITDTRH